jgi:hypothetical protein
MSPIARSLSLGVVVFVGASACDAFESALDPRDGTAPERDTGRFDTTPQDARTSDDTADPFVPWHESRCDDLEDDDFDGRIDCDDSDCTASPVCTTGRAPLHAACTTTADCAGPHPVCLTAVATDAPDGECRRWCDPGAATLDPDGCGPDAYCLWEGGERGQCVLTCTPARGNTSDAATDLARCRDAYACTPALLAVDGHLLEAGLCLPAEPPSP